MRTLNICIHFSSILLMGVFIWGCGLFSDNEFDVPNEDLVAMIAVFDNPDENGVYPAKLVLADYYNPTDYKIVTDKPIRAIEPVFSRDKTRILFGDVNSGIEDAGPQLTLYDVENENIQLLGIWGGIVTWNFEDSGIYFSNHPAVRILFYRFSNQTVDVIKYGDEYAVALKGQDTLIVFSHTVAETGQQFGFYFMDLEGNYLSRIDNPYLGFNSSKAYNPNWNDELGLFVYAEIDSTVSGSKISVTNLDGSYYETYTSGE